MDVHVAFRALLDQRVTGLFGEGLESGVEWRSVASTRSTWPEAMVFSAFLALRMGSGQLRPRASTSRSKAAGEGEALESVMG